MVVFWNDVRLVGCAFHCTLLYFTPLHVCHLSLHTRLHTTPDAQMLWWGFLHFRIIDLAEKRQINIEEGEAKASWAEGKAKA